MKENQVKHGSKNLRNRQLWCDLKVTTIDSFRKHRRLLLTSYFFNLLYIGTTVLMPIPLKFIIDAITDQQQLPGWLWQAGAGFSLTGMVLALSGAVIAITLVRSVAVRMHKVTIARVRERLSLSLRDQLLQHVQTLPPTIYTSYRTGELVHRLMNDVDLFTRLQSKTLPAVFQHVLTGIFILAIMFWMEPVLALVSFMLIPGLILLMKYYSPRLQKTTRSKRKFEGQVAGLAQEIMRGVPTIQALGGESYTRRRFTNLNAKSLQAGVENIRAATKMERIMQAAEGIAMAVITGGGALFVLNGQLTLGSLTVFVTYIKKLLTPIEKINDLTSDIARGLAAGEQIFALLRHRPLVQDGPNSQKLTSINGHFHFKNVSFHYPGVSDEQAPVLQNIDLHLYPGELTALVGASGSGKSTLMSLLLRLYEPTGGEIQLDGQPISRYSLQSYRGQIAVMLQNTHLFAGTIREALSGHGATLPDNQMWEALAFVGMDQFVRRLPGGLDAELGEDAMNLSGGQRKRISLARAFLMDRPILLLDEPLANIDTDSAAIILRALEIFRKDKTCLAITHQSSLMHMADSIYSIDNGRLSELDRAAMSSLAPTESPILNFDRMEGMLI